MAPFGEGVLSVIRNRSSSLAVVVAAAVLVANHPSDLDIVVLGATVGRRGTNLPLGRDVTVTFLASVSFSGPTTRRSDPPGAGGLRYLGSGPRRV